MVDSRERSKPRERHHRASSVTGSLLVSQAKRSVVQGAVVLSKEVLDRAKEHADAYYSRMEKVEFCENDVYVSSVPRWMPAASTWFPTAALAALGYERVPGEGLELIATVGVDTHDDHVHGPAFILVLSNDHLKFRQGNVSHQTLPGEWFVFDDRRWHSVTSSNKKAKTYLCVSVGLRQLST